MSSMEKKASTSSIWSTTGRLLSVFPAIFMPFAVIFGLELAAILLLHLAPRPPISAVLGPPVRAFFGEPYLHYPMDLVLLPQLVEYCEIPLDLLVGCLMAGAVSWLTGQALMKGTPGLRWTSGVRKAFPRYFGLFFVTFASYMLVKGGYTVGRDGLALFLNLFPKLEAGIPPRFGNLVLLAVSFVVGSVIEMLFTYAVPAMAVENLSLFKAVRASLQLMKTNLGATFLLVVAPALVYFGAVFVRVYLPAVMNRTTPDIAVWVLILNALISGLVNTFIVASTTALFIDRRLRPQAAPARASA